MHWTYHLMSKLCAACFFATYLRHKAYVCVVTCMSSIWHIIFFDVMSWLWWYHIYLYTHCVTRYRVYFFFFRCFLLKFWADFVLLPAYSQRTKWTGIANHSPFIPNGLWFVLHGIHTNMIAWCRSIYGHDSVGDKAIIFAEIWGRFCTTAADYPQRPKWTGNANHSPFISNGLLFVLHGIHTNMIAWCRSISGHDSVGGEAIIFAKISGRFCTSF